MKITYIGHSGYLVEFEHCACLFDYAVGELPVLPADRQLFVFVSHHHPDHYHPRIYELAEQYPKIQYILPQDVKLRAGNIPLLDEVQTQQLKESGSCANFVRMRSRTQRKIGDVEIETLRSTDCGVAYLVTVEGETVFHAGDMNWWAKEQEGAQYNNNMAANYCREMDLLQGRKIRAAFLPIDPGSGSCYWYGYDYFLKKIKPENVFPMHFWEDTGIVERFIEESRQREGGVLPYESRIFPVLQKGESVSIA